MSDIAQWLEMHEADIHMLAEDTGTHDEAVRFVAGLVLAGLSDDEVYARLGEAVPSWDGQRNRLEDAPEILEGVRALVAQTSEP